MFNNENSKHADVIVINIVSKLLNVAASFNSWANSVYLLVRASAAEARS